MIPGITSAAPSMACSPFSTWEADSWKPTPAHVSKQTLRLSENAGPLEVRRPPLAGVYRRRLTNRRSQSCARGSRSFARNGRRATGMSHGAADTRTRNVSAGSPRVSSGVRLAR